MTILKMKDRVRELMIELGLDVSNEMLILNITIIYLQAQRDSLAEQREESR